MRHPDPMKEEHVSSQYEEVTSHVNPSIEWMFYGGKKIKIKFYFLTAHLIAK
jgi:hypothetical protein